MGPMAAQSRPGSPRAAQSRIEPKRVFVFMYSPWCMPVPLVAMSALAQAEHALNVIVSLSTLAAIQAGFHLEPFRCRIVGSLLVFYLVPADNATRIFMSIFAFLCPAHHVKRMHASPKCVVRFIPLEEQIGHHLHLLHGRGSF